MPQLLGLVFLGAGVIAGFRAFQRVTGKMGTHEKATTTSDSGSDSRQLYAKDLGSLELDPASGIYKPTRGL